MCGICGVFAFSGKSLKSSLTRTMMDELVHRGPDDGGEYHEHGISLGMRRLSIIDIEGGKQPLKNESGSVVAFQNGEIFNYVELQDELKGRNHEFRSRSDTEVVCHLYEEMGPNFPSKLNGMFCIAVWDRSKRQLCLVRDRLGIKTIYYAEHNGILYFASEMKALLAANPALGGDLDREAIQDYLTFMYVRGERTPFHRIRKLLPGHKMIVDRNGLKVSRWWNLAEHSRPDDGRSLEDAAEQMWSLLDDSIRMRMRSDIPVGAFLSGGLDSSAISYLASKYSDGTLQTFCVGFEGAIFDEAGYAREVAKKIGSNHHETYVKHEDALNRLPELVWHLDEPNGDSAIVPTYLVSKFAAENLKVILSGLGGDELFGGYDRFNDGYTMEHVFRGFPKWIQRMIYSFLRPMMPQLYANRLDQNMLSFRDRYLQRVSIFNQNILNDLTGGVLVNSSGLKTEFDSYRGSDRVNSLLYVDGITYLPDEILHITDRMSMAVSLEARTPFLDYRLVEFATGMPSRLKINPYKRSWKLVFKKAAENRLPESILKRQKWGFGAPVKSWMKNGLNQTINRYLTKDSQLVSCGLFEPKALKAYLQTPRSDEFYRRDQRLWSLLILEVWLQVYVRGNGNKPTFTLSD